MLLPALLLFLKGCRAAEPIEWIDCASNIPEPLQGMILPNTTLPPTLHCGRLRVPMNHSEALFPNNSINLGFAMHRPPNATRLLNFNPGGPNAEVASTAWAIATNSSSAANFVGLSEFDFLAVDQRGTYQSTPIVCTLDFVLPSAIPSTAAELEAYQAAIGKYAQSCIDQTQPQGLLQHMGTENTVRDWDCVREALNYSTMDALTWSYGTYSASRYAHELPDHVGRFVLDGVFPHGLKNQDLIAYQMKAANRLLERADAYCQSDTSCAFHSQGKGSVLQAYGGALDLTISGASGNVTSDDFKAMAYLAYLSSTPSFPAFNSALYLALSGDWTGFEYSAFAPEYTAAFFPVLPTICLDQHLDDNSFSGFEKLRKVVKSVDTYNMSYLQDLTLITLCGGWPYHASADKELRVKPEMLLVAADFDLNTPAESAIYEWQQTWKSSLLIRHGDGHVSFDRGGSTNAAETGFLAGGIRPAAGTDFTVHGHSDSDNISIANPYSAPFEALSDEIA